MIDSIEIASFIIPMYEPIWKSYIINAVHTGIDISFVKRGLSIHSNTVTRADAAMGSMFIGDEKVLIPRQRFMSMNTAGQKI